MKNPLIAIALAAGLVFAGTASAADKGPRMDRQHHQRGGQELGLQVIQHLGKAMRRLDLSEEQKVAIKDEFGLFRETVKPLVQELHSGRKGLHEVITADDYNADAAAEIAEHQGQLTAEITMLVSEAAAAVMAQLSDEQRAELQAMGDERRARKEKRHEKTKARMRERKEARRKEPPEGN